MSAPKSILINKSLSNMKRWKFYKSNILKYFDKNAEILVIGASTREAEILAILNK